jgi:signal transduction histidine kinase
MRLTDPTAFQISLPAAEDRDPSVFLRVLERRYERLAQIGTSVIAALSLVFAFVAISGKPAYYAISFVAAFVLLLAVGWFLFSMRSLRREIGRRRESARPSRAGLIRKVGELNAILDASRELESARSLGDLCTRLAVGSEGLAAGDAGLVVVRSKGILTIAAATDATDRDDVALATQCQSWSSFLHDGAVPVRASGATEILAAFGEGPLAGRYGHAMEIPLFANGRGIGLVVVLRKVGSEAGFGGDALQAVGLLADVASHLILLRRVNYRMRQTNRRLLQSLEKLERAQARLVQSEKLRAIGELVSGVAHELNNPLTSLLGFAQLLTLNNSLGTESERRWVEEIQREASRCNVILQNLLGFARKSAAGKSHAQLAAIVSETLALKAYDLRNAKVEVRSAVPLALPVAGLDRQDLQQVLLNLINNAIGSMQGASRRVLTISGSAQPGTVLLEVTDTGAGIPEEQIGKIFEPFFSTKAKGDSIGLGLTTCQKILKDAGGSISVSSKVDEGTTFTLRLPIARVLVGV